MRYGSFAPDRCSNLGFAILIGAVALVVASGLALTAILLMRAAPTEHGQSSRLLCQELRYLMNIPRPFRGIITPMITPLLGQDKLDITSLELLIEYLVKGNINGIFILGSTGEAPGLSYRMRRELIDRTCLLVHRRVPVFVGISDTSNTESLALADYAARAGASALVYSPPYYFALSQKMFRGHAERFFPRLPLPVFLYNVPSLTRLQISPETVQLCSDMPKVNGIKDSSGDRSYFEAILSSLARRPDFTFLTGVEELLAEFVGRGAHGGVCGGSNLYPKLYVEMLEAASKADQQEVDRLQQKVDLISSSVYHIGEPESSYLRGMKSAASLLGLCTGVLAEPYEPLDLNEQEEIRQRLLEIQIPGLSVADSVWRS